jgi:hypothetical protein
VVEKPDTPSQGGRKKYNSSSTTQGNNIETMRSKEEHHPRRRSQPNPKHTRGRRGGDADDERAADGPSIFFNDKTGSY